MPLDLTLPEHACKIEEQKWYNVLGASFLFSFNNQSCKVYCCKVCSYCVQVPVLKHESEVESGKRKRAVVHLAAGWLLTPQFSMEMGGEIC